MSAQIKLTDEQLIILLKKGNKEAFTQIYNHYWPLLFLHVRRMLSDDDLAEDIVQELFTWLWNKGDELVITTSLSAYLYTSIRNKVFDQIRHHKIKTSRLEVFSNMINESENLVDEQIRLKELVAEIDDEIERMPVKMREIFELSRKNQLSHKEIAEQLNISEHTVRKQVQRALKLLRDRLDLSASAVLIIVYLNS